MNEHFTRQQLAEFAANTIDLATAVLIRRHVAQCAACKQQLNDIRAEDFLEQRFNLRTLTHLEFSQRAQEALQTARATHSRWADRLVSWTQRLGDLLTPSDAWEMQPAVARGAAAPVTLSLKKPQAARHSDEEIEVITGEDSSDSLLLVANLDTPAEVSVIEPSRRTPGEPLVLKPGNYLLMLEPRHGGR